MRTTSLLLAVVGCLVVVLSMLLVYFRPSTQDFMTHNDMWNGVNRFNDAFGAVTVDSLNSLPDASAETVLILIPYIQLAEEELVALARFVESGGSLLLMDDYRYGNGVLSYLGVNARFSTQPLFDPLFNFKNLRLPKVTDFTPEVTAAGVGVVLLNHATSLQSVSTSSSERMNTSETFRLPPKRVIAWSSSSSFLDTNDSGHWDWPEPWGPFPVSAQFPVGDGEVVVVADPSVLINSVVDMDDNYAFIRYLTSRNGQEQSILFATSHLPMAPLDVSKTKLDALRRILASPAGLLGITALLVIAVSRYALKKEGIIEVY